MRTISALRPAFEELRSEVIAPHKEKQCQIPKTRLCGGDIEHLVEEVSFL